MGTGTYRSLVTDRNCTRPDIMLEFAVKDMIDRLGRRSRVELQPSRIAEQLDGGECVMSAKSLKTSSTVNIRGRMMHNIRKKSGRSIDRNLITRCIYIYIYM